MLRHVTIASLLIGTLAAQTTWTSFEDRKGHAIASAPNGGLLMFGGESASSPGTLLDDTNEFTSAATNPLWRRLQPANPPTAREGHAMAAGIGALAWYFAVQRHKPEVEPDFPRRDPLLAGAMAFVVALRWRNPWLPFVIGMGIVWLDRA